LLLKNKSMLVFLLLLSLLISSCNMPQNAISPAEQTAIINASIAETVAAGGEDSAPPADSDPSISTNTPDPLIATNTPDPNTVPTDLNLTLQPHQIRQFPAIWQNLFQMYLYLTAQHFNLVTLLRKRGVFKMLDPVPGHPVIISSSPVVTPWVHPVRSN